MATTVTIPPRFNGPPDSANGGFACGVLASLLEGPAEVTLRLPPPVGVPLELGGADGTIELRQGERLIAEGRAVDGVAVELPRTFPDLEQARAAAAPNWGGHEHPFPTCFVCGPDRRPGDGMRIFPARWRETAIGAATLEVGEELPALGGALTPEATWAALDCPSCAPDVFRSGSVHVLGRLAAEIKRPPAIGEEYVAAGWLERVDGRKKATASALVDASGEPIAVARATWIQIEPR